MFSQENSGILPLPNLWAICLCDLQVYDQTFGFPPVDGYTEGITGDLYRMTPKGARTFESNGQVILPVHNTMGHEILVGCVVGIENSRLLTRFG